MHGLVRATCFVTGDGRTGPHGAALLSLLGCLQEPREQSGLKACEKPLPGDGEAGTLAVFVHGPAGYCGVREVCVRGQTDPPDVAPCWQEDSPVSVSPPAVLRTNISHCERAVAIL